jgi:hypothetical protein
LLTQPLTEISLGCVNADWQPPGSNPAPLGVFALARMPVASTPAQPNGEKLTIDTRIFTSLKRGCGVVHRVTVPAFDSIEGESL